LVVVAQVVLLQVVVVVVLLLLLQAQLVLLLLLLLLLLHELLVLAEIKVERAVHAELVLDDFVDVAILESALQRVQVQVQVVGHQAGHDAVVVEDAHQVAHDLRRSRRRFRLVLADVLRRTGAVTGTAVALGQGGPQQTRATPEGVAIVGRRQVHQTRLRRGAEAAQNGQAARAAVPDVAHKSTTTTVATVVLLLIQQQRR
jgi:hypothetical protein